MSTVTLDIDRDMLFTTVFALERRVHQMQENVHDCEDAPHLQQIWLEQLNNATRAHEYLKHIMHKHDEIEEQL